VAYVRTVKTASGATAVQIVWSSKRGSRSIEHIGSAHDDTELAALKAAAAERLAANQSVLDLGLSPPAGSEPLPITSSQMTHLWDGLCAAYRILGFKAATYGDNVFRDRVLARIIEPSSKSDAERVLREVGVQPASYATVKRRLPGYATPQWRQALAAAGARRAGLGPASLVLFDVSTLYFETDAGDGFREPGFSKERRLEPQITLGLLTDATGFPLTVEAFEGNKAETATMLPVINAFKAAHQLREVTVVADAGMISEANQVALQAAGLSYILGTRIPFLPDVVREWRARHPGETIPDGLVLTQPWPATSSEKARGIPDRVIYYQERQPRPGSQDPRPGGLEGLHHQPHRRVLGVRHRRLPPTLADRKGLPDVQARPASPPDLPPPARFHRSPPEHRAGRHGRQPLRRKPNRLEHKEIRPHRPLLSHHHDPSRQPHPHRRRPPTRRLEDRSAQDPHRRYALI
jgi:hypothetical protein